MRYYKKNTKGFILVTVLLFLQIFVLLGLYGMLSVKLILNNINILIQSKIDENEAIIISEKIENQLLDHVPKCFISITPVSFLTSHLHDEWWQEHSCRGKNDQYRYDYVVEKLGKDACTLIIKNGNDDDIAEYYRLTLRVWSNFSKMAKIILQSVIVKANHEPIPCSGIRREIKLGRQMQREIMDFKF